jgi:DNA-binding CsgD family transcriptional regulator
MDEPNTPEPDARPTAGLSEADRDALGRAIGELATLADPDTFRARILSSLRELIPCELVSYYEADEVTGDLFAIVHPQRPLFDGFVDAWAASLDEDPLIGHYLRTGDGSAVKLSDFVAPDELRRSRKWQTIYRRLGIAHKITMVLDSPELPPGAAAAARIGQPRISLYRAPPDFTERERSLLNASRPLIAEAASQVAQRARLRGVAGAASSGDGGWGVLSGGRHGDARDPARVRQYGPDGAHPGGGIMTRSSPEELTERVGAIAAGTLLGVAVDPLAERGLTRREAEVLALAARGAATRDIARELAIAASTVRKHFERIYEKLGVTSRGAAVNYFHMNAPRPTKDA